MKYYPKFGLPIHAEQYDGTPESVECINAMLKEHGTTDHVGIWDGMPALYLDVFVYRQLKEGDHISRGKEGTKIIPEVCMQHYSPSPVPIKPLEWQDFDEFIWAEGVNCIYKYWVVDRAFDVLDKHGEQTLSIDDLTFAEAKQAAQAHHDAQVLALLNLPE